MNTLYGLQDIPSNWWGNLIINLKYIDLQATPTNPLVYMGTLTPGDILTYIVIYVNNVFYFMKSNTVEEQSIS